MRKIIEYEVTTLVNGEHDVNHVNWREAKKLVDNPPEDVLLIERVTRYGENNLDGIEFDELKKYETLYEREGEK